MIRNRYKARAARGDKSKWCGPCDGALVRDGSKCHVCGKRDPHVRDKSPAPDDDDTDPTWEQTRAEAEHDYTHRPDFYGRESLDHSEPMETALDVFMATRGWRDRANGAVLGDEE